MARKLFISFLGFSNYKECMYYKDDFCSSSIRYIQEATLDYLQQLGEWTEEDVAYILLTEGAKAKNWVDNGQRNPKTNEIIVQKGLETSLKQKNYPFQIKTIEQLPDGKNEKELFDLFRRIYDVMLPGDALYFDITHGFRSLPMLALVLINYAKFLKGVEVKSITYGNFEAREELHDSDGNICLKAPIIDLLPLSGIQDWTFAAADYLKNGNADKFTELSRAYKSSLFKGLKTGNKEEAIDIDSLTNELKAVTDDFKTCRGNNILSSKNISALKKKLEQFDRTVIEPLNPVVRKLENAFSAFEETTIEMVNCKNGLEAARWCMYNHLFQQAATILQECVVTFFCIRYGLNINSDVERKLVNGAFAKCEKLNFSKTKEEEKEAILKEVESNTITQKLINDKQISDRVIYEAFSMLTTERNDINHSGMRPQPHTSDKIRNNIKKAYAVFQDKLFKTESTT